MSEDLIPIQNMIYEIRGQRVMLDGDLARLYEVEVRYLNRQVNRNIKRFPVDFMFQLTKEEWDILKCQFGTSSWGGKRKLPSVFTEQGIAMLSGLLNSDVAINVNIQIMRAFVQMRQYALSQFSTNNRVEEIYKTLMLHIENTDYKLSEHDQAISQIIHALNNLIEQPPKKKRPIGFIQQYEDDD
jgi:hypothetical protein